VKKSPILYILVSRVAEKLPETHWTTAVVAFGGIVFMLTLQQCQKRLGAKFQHVKSRVAKTALLIFKMPAVIYLVLLGILLGSSLCNYNAFGEWTHKHAILGRGATFPALFYSSVIEKLNCELYSDGVQIEYEATGSGDGLQTVLTSDSVPVDFVGSDIKPSSADIQKYSLEVFPVVSSILCPAVNLPILAGSTQIRLILDLPTVADIFNGKITSWVDARIRSLNPNLPWHSVGDNRPISVVVRSDESGTTQAFAETLLNCEGCDATVFAASMKLNWGAPKQIQAKGMDGMVSTIGETPWSIGYATFSETMAFEGSEGSESKPVCAALATGAGIATAQLAWASPNLVPWPLWHTSYMLVSPTSAVAATSEHPRLESCKARNWLKTFAEELFTSPEEAREHHFKLEPRHKDIDKLACGDGSSRRLAAKACTKPKPKCQDIKMVGYIQPASLQLRCQRQQQQCPSLH
jgi:phosphate transport system substrate-binding protein